MSEKRVERLQQLLSVYWKPVLSLVAGVPVLLNGLKVVGLSVPLSASTPEGRWLLIAVGVALFTVIRFPRVGALITRWILGPPPPLPSAGGLFHGPRPYAKGENLPARQADSDECWRLIQERPFVILEGESGCGKSSLLKAALLPRAEGPFRVIECRVANDPFGNLLSVLSGGPSTKPRHPISKKAVAVAIAAAAAPADTGEHSEPARPLLLFIDQCEELFVTVKDEERLRFITVLKDAIQAGKLRLLVAIRKDFFDLLRDVCREVDPEQQVLNLGSYYTLRAFRRDQAEVVLGEILQAAHGDDPLRKQQQEDFISALVKELLRPPRDKRLCQDDEKSVLPLELQVAGMVIERRGMEPFSVGELRRLGGLPGLLRAYLEEAKTYVLRKTGVPGEQSLLVLRQLISPAGTTQVQTAAEVGAALNLLADLVEGALQAFADKYLVCLQPGEVDGPARYELMHDHLVQILREAPDPILQKARDAEERLRFWIERMRVAFTPWGSGQPSLALHRFRSLLTQPVPVVECLYLWRFAPRGDARRLLLLNLRGFGLRVALAALLLALPLASWRLYVLTDSYQIEKIVVEAPVEGAASNSSGVLYSIWWDRDTEADETVTCWAMALARSRRFGQAMAATRELRNGVVRSYALVAVAQELMEVGGTEEAKKALEEALATIGDRTGEDRTGEDRTGPSGPKMAFADGSVHFVSSEPGRPACLVNVAKGLAQAGEVERAFLITRSLKEQSPVVAAVAEGLVRSGKIEDALALAAGIKDENARSTFLEDCAGALVAAGKVDEVVALSRELRNDMDRSRALQPAVDALLAEGKVDKALDVAGQLRNSTGKAHALARVVEWLRQQGRAKEAAQVREKHLSFVRSLPDSELYSAQRVVAVLFIKEGKIDEAKEAWRNSEKALSTPSEGQPMPPVSDDQFRISMAEALAETGEVDQTLAAAHRLQNKSRQARALVSIANGLFKAGEHAQARKILGEALSCANQIKSDTERSRTRAAVAKGLAQLRLYREARLTCEECSSLDKLAAYTIILVEYERAQPGGSQRPLPKAPRVPITTVADF